MYFYEFGPLKEKVYEELHEIFNGEERPVTPQDILKMKYLERVIKETLRLFTVTPSITRELSNEIIVDLALRWGYLKLAGC
ncbi:hypothetical protein NQ314_014000 [Rhamnusium bicolor]|uniref:Cytochrome P450 n=1 Tax=Rhamnusium bicolor TaxID=1586634 RepID=A0AAV8X4C3_9CUCU|nr:hypothetical protein NQ314_014000 [Rhamnusium bicolor]